MTHEKGNIGEEFVNEIAYKSILNFWCYPSPKDEKGDKKEICDLLILFKTNAIIISVKNYEFKDKYSRYFRKTIDKAVSQIYGAERKLFMSNRDVFIKHPKREIERFEPYKYSKTYRIIVNLGEGVKFYPLSQKSKNDGFITLFDKDSFKTIMEELDTIPDLIDYLNKREILFHDKEVIALPGKEDDFPIDTAFQFHEYALEKMDPSKGSSILLSGTEYDLLASFIMNERKFPDHLTSKEYDSTYIQIDGKWDDFLARKQVKFKKSLDEKSYFIDQLVEKEILIHKDKRSLLLAEELMSFSRFERRSITESFFDFYSENEEKKGEWFARRYGDFNSIGIVFCYYTEETPNDMVNTLMSIALESFIMYSNYKHEKMIIIATTFKMKQFKMGIQPNVEKFPKEYENQIKKDVKTLGWFTNYQAYKVTAHEYPEINEEE